jgi:hypothetical protein
VASAAAEAVVAPLAASLEDAVVAHNFSISASARANHVAKVSSSVVVVVVADCAVVVRSSADYLAASRVVRVVSSLATTAVASTRATTSCISS